MLNSTLSPLPFQRDRVFQYAYRLTMNRDEAEDLVQDAMVRAFRSAETLSQVANATPWICQVVLNLFRDRCRQVKRTPRALSLDATLAEDPSKEPACTATTADQTQLPEEIQDLLKALPVAERAEVLAWAHGYGEISPRILKKLRRYAASRGLRRFDDSYATLTN